MSLRLRTVKSSSWPGWMWWRSCSRAVICLEASSISSVATAEAKIMSTVPRNCVPSTRRSAVEKGMTSDVVLVLTPRGLSLGLEHADDLEGHVLDAHLRAHRVFAGPNRWSTTVWPSTTTRFAVSSSRCVKKLPPTTGQSRTL